MKNKDVNGRHIYINGLSDNMEDAFEDAIDRSSSEENVKNLALYYSPASIANDLGVWHSPGQTHKTSIVIKELTEVLQHNIKVNQGVHWLAEGEGCARCALLSKTLENVKGELKNYCFKLINQLQIHQNYYKTLHEKKAH
jgi:hypothetical protein